MKTNDEYTGGSTTYYQVDIAHPINTEAQPYTAECQDIIDALGMTFNEGNAFKALWRRCAARTLGKSKRGYTDGLYDAEKVVFYGERLVQLEQRQRAVDTTCLGPVVSDVTVTAPWMPHPKGHGCPVRTDEAVEVTFADGYTSTGLAGNYVWTSGNTKRITHWRPYMPA